MSMSKIVLSTMVAAGLMVVGMNAFAMPAQHEGMDAHKMALKMQKELTLSDDQTAKIEAIFKDTHEEAEKLREDLMELKDKTDAKIKAELDDEQNKKFDAMQKKRMDRRQQRMNNQAS